MRYSGIGLIFNGMLAVGSKQVNEYYKYVSPGPLVQNFLWRGVLSLRVPTKMGVTDDIWAWPIKFAVLCTIKL